MVRAALWCFGFALLGCEQTAAPKAEGLPRSWAAAPHRSSVEFEPEIQAFEAEDAQVPRLRGANLFVGSSSIRLWKSLATDFERHTVVNRGFGGARIRNVIDFGRRIVLPHAPSRIVFFAGANDIHAGASPEEVLVDFKTFAAGIHEVLPNTQIGFISITTSPARFHEVSRVREANRLVREYVASHPKLTFIDVFPLMVDAEGRPKPELYLADRLHPSQQAYALWAERIEPFLEQPAHPSAP